MSAYGAAAYAFAFHSGGALVQFRRFVFLFCRLGYWSLAALVASNWSSAPIRTISSRFQIHILADAYGGQHLPFGSFRGSSQAIFCLSFTEMREIQSGISPIKQEKQILMNSTIKEAKIVKSSEKR